uniref:Acrosin n=1 Tax=Erpetoichthys calabaricus TaxID=27687 RepID=A0A8C4RH67_ERPCA
ETVIGGSDSLPGAWPWQVSLQYNFEHKCEGSIISNNWILTAAHCLENYNSWKVVAGLNERHLYEWSTQIRYPIKFILHNKFKERTVENDIALVRLDSPLFFTDFIQPICILNQKVEEINFTNCFITGFGVVSSAIDNPIFPPVLQEAEVNLIPKSVCRKSNWNGKSVTDKMLCAGYKEGGIGACWGDSGGPLQCFSEKKRRFYLVGITSWVKNGCALPGNPAVFTCVSSYFYSFISTNATGTYTVDNKHEAHSSVCLEKATQLSISNTCPLVGIFDDPSIIPSVTEMHDGKAVE